jgi:phytoene synthase
MTTFSISWEEELLRKATHSISKDFLPSISVDELLLEEAYALTARLTRQHSRTFYLTSGLLPPAQRRAARALYAFCRVSDDLVDEEAHGSREKLARWKKESLAEHPPLDAPIALAWADTRARYRIPVQYAEQLLDGVSQDLVKSRYRNFDELAHYCYGVASTVGLMVMHIIGFESKAAIPYAIKLGVALQLTNILRDVGEDWENGRLYLPQDELALYGLCEADIAAGVVDKRWRAFMRFQIRRARRLYREAQPGIAMLGKSGRFAIAAAAGLYQGIMEDIEANNFDVFNHRAHLSGAQKLLRLPAIWVQART